MTAGRPGGHRIRFGVVNPLLSHQQCQGITRGGVCQAPSVVTLHNRRYFGPVGPGRAVVGRADNGLFGPGRVTAAHHAPGGHQRLFPAVSVPAAVRAAPVRRTEPNEGPERHQPGARHQGGPKRPGEQNIRFVQGTRAAGARPMTGRGPAPGTRPGCHGPRVNKTPVLCHPATDSGRCQGAPWGPGPLPRGAGRQARGPAWPGRAA